MDLRILETAPIDKKIMSKVDKYRELVGKRKLCSKCRGLYNPHCINGGKWDSEEIGPWSLWQGNLDAEVLVVGQDWGDISYFTKWRGRDEPFNNPTNENLQELLKIIGIEIRKPLEPQDNIVFFTNVILCLKDGGLQGTVKNEWFKNCSQAFFLPLIDIISPKVIVSLGKKVSESIFDLYGVSYSKNIVFSKTLKNAPYQLSNSTVLFPVYHCGARGVNINRPMLKQKQDWSKINIWIQRNSFR